MKVEVISFKVIKDIWSSYVWPGELIWPVDNMQYGGYEDDEILEYSPTFFGIKENGIIVAALGGHRTTSKLYRLRGLFIDKDVNNPKEYIGKLLSEFLNQARLEGCTNLWYIEDQYHEYFPTHRKQDGVMIFSI